MSRLRACWTTHTFNTYGAVDIFGTHRSSAPTGPNSSLSRSVRQTKGTNTNPGCVLVWYLPPAVLVLSKMSFCTGTTNLPLIANWESNSVGNSCALALTKILAYGAYLLRPYCLPAWKKKAFSI